MTDYWYRLAKPTLARAEIDAAIEVLRSGDTTMGDRVEEFEEAFARYVGAEHAVMVNSGSSADLLIAFAAGHHGEVLVPAVTWPTHVWSWEMAGTKVRLIDVDGLNTTAQIIANNITPETRAVSLVHLMGVPCDMDAIEKVVHGYGLPLYEDCCEALGARWNGLPVGTSGMAASWSFFFSHHMTTMEGGMVTTPSAQFAEKLRTLRSHGWARHMRNPPAGDPRYTFVDWGFNLRPTEVAAAIGLAQLSRLDVMNERRRRNFNTIAAAVADCYNVEIPEAPEGTNWFGIPLFSDSRDSLAAHLEENGIETRPILAGNLARQPAIRKHKVRHSLLTGADRVHDRGLYIGLHPDNSSDAERVAHELCKWGLS